LEKFFCGKKNTLIEYINDKKSKDGDSDSH